MAPGAGARAVGRRNAEQTRDRHRHARGAAGATVEVEGSILRTAAVSEKDAAVYRRIMDRYGIAPDRFLMAGNSLHSDVLPVIEAGGHAVRSPISGPGTAAVDTRWTEPLLA